MNFNTKDLMIRLARTCFWYWETFYSFLESCDIPSSIYIQFGRDGGKHHVMRSILELLERQQAYDSIKQIMIQFYNLDLGPLKGEIDLERAKNLLQEFRTTTGPSLIQDEVNQRERENKIEAQKRISEQKKFAIAK